MDKKTLRRIILDEVRGHFSNDQYDTIANQILPQFDQIYLEYTQNGIEPQDFSFEFHGKTIDAGFRNNMGSALAAYNIGSNFLSMNFDKYNNYSQDDKVTILSHELTHSLQNTLIAPSDGNPIEDLGEKNDDTQLMRNIWYYFHKDEISAYLNNSYIQEKKRFIGAYPNIKVQKTPKELMSIMCDQMLQSSNYNKCLGIYDKTCEIMDSNPMTRLNFLFRFIMNVNPIYYNQDLTYHIINLINQNNYKEVHKIAEQVGNHILQILENKLEYIKKQCQKMSYDLYQDIFG